MAIDYVAYMNAKTASAAQLVKVDPDTIVFLQPQFDQGTGKPAGALSQQTNLAEIDEGIAQLQIVLQNMQALRADAVAALGK